VAGDLTAPTFNGMKRIVLVVLTLVPLAAQAQVWTLNTDRSELIANAFRGGGLSPFLHDHHFRPTPDGWKGEIRFEAGQPDQASVAIEVRADSLRDDQPRLSEADRMKVNQQVASPRVLDAERYPVIRLTAGPGDFEIESKDGDGVKGRLHATLLLHGRARPVDIPLEVEVTSEALIASGRLLIRQSDFGIHRYSKLGGAVSVKDEVLIDVKLVATPPKA
jgi:polyisoprenoid-binding protein YceI